MFLTESKEDGLLYVLKKVECNDESEANKAFKEVWVNATTCYNEEIIQ